MLRTTLLMIVKDGRILLARKKRGFGVGKLNGVGGKNIDGETIDETMIRETREEIFVTPTKYEKMAVISFDEVVKGERTKVEMSIYLSTDFDGEIGESDEMKPEWFEIDKIPYEQMFADDRFWLPEILQGHKLVGEFVYDDDFKIVSRNLRRVSHLD